MRVLHLARTTEKAYVNWIIQFVRFAKDESGDWVYPADLNETHVKAMRARTSQRLPLVLSPMEVKRILDAVSSRTPRLMLSLMYGAWWPDEKLK